MPLVAPVAKLSRSVAMSPQQSPVQEAKTSVATDYSGEADGTGNISITADITDAAGNAAIQSSVTLSKVQ